jgi:tRNA A-37 threonylcarbamoyl transferase component Bud32
MKDLSGITIERYKITNELGRGGMAIVYRAIDTMLDRKVAIKIILPETTSKEKSLKRFHREAKTLANLAHSNIVKVLDYGDYEGSPYLVMEYISGGTLSSRLGKPMPYAEAAAILAPVARALHHAHQQKVVHRDIKPSNILINDSGQPMLSDFGILKLIDLEESQGITGTGKSVGTPAYMSPEQIRGKEIDGRTDIYSLGVVFFELVTGRKPYNATTPIEVSLQHLHDPIPKAKQFVRDLPSDVEQIIVKSMAKNPEDRYPTMIAFAHALEKLSGITTVTPHTGWDLKQTEAEPAPEKKSVKLKPALLVAAPLIMLLGLAFIFFRPPGQATVTPTKEPTVVLKTATLSPVPVTQRETATRPAATNTPEVGYTLEFTTPTIVPDTVIQRSNVSSIIQVNRLDRISVVKMDWMQDGSAIVNAGSSAISFLDPDGLAVKNKINMPGEVPLGMALSQQNDKLCILVGGMVKVYDLESYELSASYPTSGGASSIALSPDGKLIALGISDNKVQIISAEDGHVISNFRSYYGGWSVAFSPDSSIVAGGTSQGVLMWEVETGTWLGLEGEQISSIKSLTFSNDGTMLAGGTKGMIYVWNVEDGSLRYQFDGDFGDVLSLDFSTDSSMLLSGSEDGIVRIWDTVSGRLLKTLTGHTSAVFGVSFSPSGENIVSGANEGVIRIWGIP